ARHRSRHAPRDLGRPPDQLVAAHVEAGFLPANLQVLLGRRIDSLVAARHKEKSRTATWQQPVRAPHLVKNVASRRGKDGLHAERPGNSLSRPLTHRRPVDKAPLLPTGGNSYLAWVSQPTRAS